MLCRCACACALGEKLLDVENGRSLSQDSPPCEHMTVVFNTFVLMTLFNEINARKLHNERNVFEGLFSNPLFLFIWIGSYIVQVSYSSAFAPFCPLHLPLLLLPLCPRYTRKLAFPSYFRTYSLRQINIP